MGRAKLRRVSKAREVIDLSQDGELRRCSSDRAAHRAHCPRPCCTARFRAHKENWAWGGKIRTRFERKMGEATTRSALRLRAYAFGSELDSQVPRWAAILFGLATTELLRSSPLGSAEVLI